MLQSFAKQKFKRFHRKYIYKWPSWTRRKVWHGNNFLQNKVLWCSQNMQIYENLATPKLPSIWYKFSYLFGIFWVESPLHTVTKYFKSKTKLQTIMSTIKTMKQKITHWHNKYRCLWKQYCENFSHYVHFINLPTIENPSCLQTTLALALLQ